MEPKKANDPDELGGWRVTGRLGEGAFGTVFLAQKGAQKAAIKIIRDFLEGEGVERFQLEIAALKKLNDPYIARIIDADLNSKVPWFATEFVNGPTLEEKVKYEGVLEELSWLNLASNLFHALRTSHTAGVVHKDVKPGNIILGETGNKLIDFGIAHVSGQTRIINIGEFEGSRPYSSPESSTGKSLPGMDVFSAAVTLAFAGQGRTIWKSNSELQLMRSINEDVPDLSGLSELQQNFLLPLLNKDASERPTSESAYTMSLELIASYGKKDSSKGLSEWVRKSKIKKKRRRGLLFYVGNSIVAFFLFIGLLLSGTRIYGLFDSQSNNSPKASSTSSPGPEADSTSSAKPSVSTSQSSTPKASPSPLASISLTPKPAPSSSGSLKESSAEAANVVVSSIFGRSFEANGGLDWSVPLTSSSSEPVPPITNLQFRLVGYPNKTWLDVGYELKVSNLGVQAIVDKLYFELLFKKKVCPEFRFVRVENNLVVKIWNSGTPDCASDYIP
ncbi:serine/threonine protein kinase [Candidatus Planktophila versatilis]|uniref:serine/threonine protein kinase n=1 Tax=Candidatus Planktophila versatilis TaxID=1884905 RepID=UPI000BACA900|nr:serine/threonine-protein kinase [Candidatus Planktophila versatilis]ASY26182.1 serine/threonine kinase [Candidatus Planktophila versatilis]